MIFSTILIVEKEQKFVFSAKKKVTLLFLVLTLPIATLLYNIVEFLLLFFFIYYM